MGTGKAVRTGQGRASKRKERRQARKGQETEKEGRVLSEMATRKG